jgi:apolipoprotein D and lipocalin family protein
MKGRFWEADRGPSGIYKPGGSAMVSSLYLLLGGVTLSATIVNGQQTELEVVPHVDLNRYAGRWYEIARLPNRFEKKCADSVTATYSLRTDGKVEVVNRCRKSSGDYTTATGKAKVVDKTTNAKLKVTFFWPFYGDYWILNLDDNYEYAVVGAPNRKYLWILSRSRQMDESLYQTLLAKAAAQGFKTEQMIKTLQPDGQ